MHKYPMIPVVATIVRIVAIIAFAFVILQAISGAIRTKESIQKLRKQIVQGEQMAALDPRYAEQVAEIKAELKPLRVVEAYSMPLFIFFLSFMILAITWGVADLFLAVRAIEYNTRAANGGPEPPDGAEETPETNEAE